MKRISLIYGLMRGVLEFQFYNYPVKEFVKIFVNLFIYDVHRDMALGLLSVEVCWISFELPLTSGIGHLSLILIQ